MNDSDRLFAHGRPNPSKAGWSIRSSAGEEPNPQRLEDVAVALGRPIFFVDDAGYECEIIGGATASSGDLAYVESRSKDVGYNQYGDNQRQIDVAIRIHLVERYGKHVSADIESYNPYFGCDVRLFEWIGSIVVLIYREKHSTYACRFGDIWPPRFAEIEDRWIVNENVLGYVGYKDKTVRRLTFPQLDEIPSLSIDEAARLGQLPHDPYGK